MSIKNKLQAESVYDRIMAHYEEDRPLSKDDLLVEQRVRAAWSMMLNDFSSEHKAIKRLSNAFKITQRTARKDVEAALTIFGSVNISNKEANKKILLHKANHIYQIAAKQEPPDLAAMNKSVNSMIKIMGVEKEEGINLGNVNLPKMVAVGIAESIKERVDAMGDWRARLDKIRESKLEHLKKSRSVVEDITHEEVE